MSKLLTTIIPSLLAGGLLFGSALTEAQPAPPTAPTPPTPPTAPMVKPPKPPKPPKPAKPDISIHLDLDNLDNMVDEQIQHALEAIGSDPHIPQHVRDAVKKRLEKVRVKVKSRLAKVNPSDLEELGEELGRMGEEIGEEMEQFGEEMEKFGKQFEKQFDKKFEKQLEKQLKLKHWSQKSGHQPVVIDLGDSDDEDDLDSVTDFDDMDDLSDALKDLSSLKLDQQQRAALKQLRADSDAKVARAKVDLDRASEALQRLLEDTNVDPRQIAQSIDNVTRLEADIRKARILAWVTARKLLDNSQRQKVEAAARGRSK
jgi:hypothetical protein